MSTLPAMPEQPELARIFPPSMRPAEPTGLRWTLRLLKVPGLGGISQRLLLRWLPRCRDIRMGPGFRCLYGNIVASDVSFNELHQVAYDVA